MINALIYLKRTIFGIVVFLWGVLILVSTSHMKNEVALNLLFTTIPYPVFGFWFIFVGIVYIVSKFFDSPTFTATSHILLSSVFLSALLSHLYGSIYNIAWIAFIGVIIHQLINAYLYLRNK